MSQHFHIQTKFIGILLFAVGVGQVEARHIAHRANEKFKIVGGFTLNETELEKNNPGLKKNRYGTTTILKPKTPEFPNPVPELDKLTKTEIVIRDQHYQLIDWSKGSLSKWVSIEQREKDKTGFGIRLIPAAQGFKDKHSGKSGNLTIKGSQVVDEYLRKVVYGYGSAEDKFAPTRNGRKRAQTKADQPIFTMIGYVHPEAYAGDAFSLAGMLKTEMGFTHQGIYIGDGKTVNSPPGYHEDTWWDEGQPNYPAFVTVMDFKGLVRDGSFDVRSFNRNGIITAMVLNELNDGAQFPRETDYKFDPLYSINLETVLDFYVRWLKRDKIFTEDTPEAIFYKSYCAEHATEIANVLINLPQNLEGYRDTFGRRDLDRSGKPDGDEIFELAMDRIYDNEQLRSGDEAIYIRDMYLGKREENERQFKGLSFIPYWKSLEANVDAADRVSQPVSPAANGQWVATKPRFKEVGYSLAWKPETVADLLKDFVKAYLPWPTVGSLTTVTAVFGFTTEAKKRMAIDTPQYVKHISPIVQQVFLHEAAMERGDAQIQGQTDEDELYKAFRTARAKRQAGIKARMDGIIASLQANRNVRLNRNETLDVEATAAGFMNLIASGVANPDDETPANDQGWKAVKELAKSAQNFAAPRGVDPRVAFRDSIYDREFTNVVQPMLKELNNIDANKPPANGFTEKFYYAPAVHVRVALGLHDADSERRQAVRLWPVGHVIRAEETVPLPEQDKAVVNDSLFELLDVI